MTGETFYTALEVAADADGETIRRAYRTLVKECHPDVSDDPSAPERFKRLTTARNVLLDDTERARYDRLGHEEYVRRHVESGTWTDSGAERDRRGDESGTDSRTPTGGSRTTDRTAWLGEDRHARRDHPGSDPGRTTGYARGQRDGQPWQRASRVYRRAETDLDGGQTKWGRIVDGVRAVGPWLPIHVVLILSALATGWVTYVHAVQTTEPSLTLLSAGVLAFGVIVCLSVVHVISQVYT